MHLRLFLLVALLACAEDPTLPALVPVIPPPDLADMTFSATGSPTHPYTMLEVSRRDGFQGLVLVNGRGEVVWHFRWVGRIGGVTVLPDGHLVAIDDTHGLIEIAPDGRVLRRLPQRPDSAMFHHDVIATAAGSVLVLARELSGGIVGEAIWEWWPRSGEVRRRWSAFQDLDTIADWTPRSTKYNWLHANSLAIGPRGNVLVSLHKLNQVISVRPDWGGLEWRLGGPGATHGVAHAERFSGQHTAAEVRPGRVLMFDNRHEQADRSRAVEWELDGSAARKAWEWRPARDNFAFAVGAARRLENGNTMVTFGMSPGLLGSTGPIEVYEVSPAGQVVWRLQVDGPTTLYRAWPLTSPAFLRGLAAP